MDPALLKQREAFLKRAAATPTVFKKNEKRSAEDGKEKAAKKPKAGNSSQSQDAGTSKPSLLKE